MSTITDWLTTIFTGAYLVATILIYWMNRRSVKAMHDQLDESKKQYEETRRLQVMPYLHAIIKECEYDDEEKELYPRGDFVTFKDYSITLPFTEEDNPDIIRVDKYLLLVNNGLGILHHAEISWTWEWHTTELAKTFCNDIVIAPHGKWGVIIALYFNRNRDISECKDYKIFIKFMDLLGNKYKQELRLDMSVNDDHTEIIISSYSITSPELIIED